MSVSTNPSDDAIEQCMALTGCSHKQAFGLLKRYDNDANRAINAFLDNPEINFAEDELNPTNQVFDTSNDTTTTSVRLPSPSRQGAEQWENAAEPPDSSRYAVGPWTGQESGVIPTASVKFGPATKDHYEETSWAMTLIEPTTHDDAQTDPDPEMRRKDDDAPAFLRPSQEAQHLAGFLTILHNIPKVREALLLRARVLDDYGHDDQWWNGQPIKLTEEQQMDAVQRYRFGILTEAQRLMAFLDDTKRAYGSADQLADLCLTSGASPEETIDQFMSSWEDAATEAASDCELTQIFQWFCMRISRTEQDEMDCGSGDPFRMIDCYVYPDRHVSLYDAIDETIWLDLNKAFLDDIWIETTPAVLTVRATNPKPNSSSVEVSIPAELYVDRYLSGCRDWAKALRRRRIDTEDELSRLDKLISFYRHSTSTDTRTLLEDAKKGAELLLSDSWTTGLIEDDDRKRQAEESHARIQTLTSTLEDLAQQVQSKIETLEKRKKEIVDELTTTARKFTKPSDVPEENPSHKYILCGVCTLPHVMYVLRDGWQWWRISFSVEDAKASARGRATKQASNAPVAGYTARRVRRLEVLRAAREAASSILLVYAREQALASGEEEGGLIVEERPGTDLPEPLKRFVQLDNEAFEQEAESFNADLAANLAAQAATIPTPEGSGASESEPDLIDLATEPSSYQSGPIDPGPHPQLDMPAPQNTPQHTPQPYEIAVEGQQLLPETANAAPKDLMTFDNSDREDNEGDQPLRIEVEDEQGNWNMMKFPASEQVSAPPPRGEESLVSGKGRGSSGDRRGGGDGDAAAAMSVSPETKQPSDLLGDDKPLQSGDGQGLPDTPQSIPLGEGLERNAKTVAEAAQDSPGRLDGDGDTKMD